MAIWGDTLGTITSKFNFGAIGTTITWLIIFFLLFVISAVVIFILINRKKYNYIIEIYEDLAGTGPKRIATDTAYLAKIGDDGSQIYRLKKYKIYRQGYGKKVGINRIAFCIASDGLWYNVVWGDFDKSLAQMGFKPVDKDIRMANVNLRRILEKEYKTETFLQKYGGLIAFSSLIILLGISIWLGTWNQIKMSDKINAALQGNVDTQKQNEIIAQQNAETMKQSAEVMKAAAEVLTRYGVYQSSGTGTLKPAT